jgi:rhomboid protease GluP
MIILPFNILIQSPEVFTIMGMSEAVFKGEVYRIVTSIWIHATVVHLASNLLFLFIFSLRLEELTKGRTVVIVFICSGVAGNIGSILWILFEIPTISVGASGAVFGILGALIYLLKGKSKVEQRKMIYFLVIFFSITISQNTNFLSHLFGLIGGSVTMKALKFLSENDHFQFL